MYKWIYRTYKLLPRSLDYQGFNVVKFSFTDVKLKKYCVFVAKN